MNENKRRFASLYTQITAYVIVSLLFGAAMFYLATTIGKSVIRSTDIINKMSNEKIDYSVQNLKDTIQDTENIYDDIDDWVYDNKYYVVYLLDDDGSVVYSNDALFNTGEGDFSFPVERQITVETTEKEMQLVVVYLASTEVGVKLNILAVVLSFFSAAILFFFLIKRIIDRVKWISRQLEFISAGDIDLHIQNLRNDEVGTLIDNINRMKTSLVLESTKNTQLEEEKYSRIASMSHDLRTPLTIVMGYLDVLKDKELDTETREYLDRIEIKVEEIQNLSTNLFSTTTDTKKQVNNTLVMHTQLDQSIQMLARNLELANFNVNLKSETNTHAYVMEIEKSFLKQMLTAIESNISKYAKNSEDIIITIEQSQKEVYITFDNEITDSVDRAVGFGQGLSLLKQVLSQSGGNVSYQVNDNRFFLLITIPIFWI